MQPFRIRKLSYELLHPRCPTACLYVDHAFASKQTLNGRSMGAYVNENPAVEKLNSVHVHQRAGLSTLT